MQDPTPYYRAYLKTALASEYNQNQVGNMLGQFDKIAPGGAEMAFSVVLEAFGNESTPKAVKTIKEWIERELQAHNAKHPGIDRNSTTRLKRIIEAHNKAIDKCCILINGVQLSREEIDKIKAKLPACLNQKTVYEAKANEDSRARGLTLEITI
jgi:hypothetical protein